MWCALYALLFANRIISCTFNNISIKLTWALCIWYAVWTMLFSPTYSLFLHVCVCVCVFLLCPCFDHLLLFFYPFSILFQSSTVHCFCCCCFQSATMTYSFVSNFVCNFFCKFSAAKRKAHLDVALFNKSKRQSVCAYMQMYVIKIIASHTVVCALK